MASGSTFPSSAWLVFIWITSKAKKFNYIHACVLPSANSCMCEPCKNDSSSDLSIAVLCGISSIKCLEAQSTCN